MSTSVRIILALVVLAAVAGGAYYVYVTQILPSSPSESSQTAVVSTSIRHAAKPVDTTASSGPATLPTGTQSSDAALTTDLSAIDTQLAGLGTDTAAASKSLADTPVPQSALK